MAQRSLYASACKLRPRLESARLHLLALFRALDQMHLSANQIPQTLLHGLFELDADLAEALWAIDQPAHSLDFGAVLSDTTAALSTVANACDRLRANLPPHAASALPALQAALLSEINPNEAYNQIPGRDPENC